MDSFVIRTYGRTELAQIYCPNLCPEAAFRKLKHWIDPVSYTHLDYQRAIKQKGCRLVCVDDMHDKHYVADVVTVSYTHLLSILRYLFFLQGQKLLSPWRIQFR